MNDCQRSRCFLCFCEKFYCEVWNLIPKWMSSIDYILGFVPEQFQESNVINNYIYFYESVVATEMWL